MTLPPPAKRNDDWQYASFPVPFALAAGARSDETNEDLAQSEGRQSGAESATPNPSPDITEMMNG